MDVRWTSDALADIDQIQDYIAQDSPSAAFKLVSNVIGRTNTLLADNPMIGRRGRASGTRELVIAGTAYIVAYRVTDEVEILAVIHGAQDWPDEF